MTRPTPSPRAAAVLLALVACAGTPADTRAPELPNDEDLAGLAPAQWSPLSPVTGDPVNAAPVQPEFWKLGQAACPEGATFSPATAPYFQTSCTADGVIHGPTATFDEAGHLLILEGYVRGQAEGQHLSFWPGGKPKLETTWHLGRQHGPYVRYHDNGQKAEEGAWRDGRLDGEIRAYASDGKLLGTSTLTLGTGTYTEWHANGTKAIEHSFIDGLEHGITTAWHPNGTKASETTHDHGVRHGRRRDWSDTGTPIRAGQFENDKETRRWAFYDTSGQLAHVDTYVAGDVVATVLYKRGKPLGQPRADERCNTAASLAAVYQEQTGQPLRDGDAHCVRPALHFPGVVAIGDFATDRGCAGAHVMVDCKYHDAPDGAAILARAGWARADPTTRELLARAYVDEVASPWNRSGDASPRSEPNGDLVVTATISYQGMRGEHSYRESYRITPAGQVHKQPDP